MFFLGVTIQVGCLLDKSASAPKFSYAETEINRSTNCIDQSLRSRYNFLSTIYIMLHENNESMAKIEMVSFTVQTASVCFYLLIYQFSVQSTTSLFLFILFTIDHLDDGLKYVRNHLKKSVSVPHDRFQEVMNTTWCGHH